MFGNRSNSGGNGNNEPTLTFEISADKTGLVIGSKGATKKSLEQKYGVRVRIVENVWVNLYGPVQNCEECQKEILSIVDRQRGRRGMNTQSSRQRGDGGGGFRARDDLRSEFFIFHRNSTGNLQVLLQAKDGGYWDIPSIDAGVSAGEYLGAAIGGQNVPLDQLREVTSIHLQSAKKQLLVYAVPPSFQNWIPSPTQEGLAYTDVSGQEFEFGGKTFVAGDGYLWIDVMYLMVDVRQFTDNIKMFFQRNAATVLSKVEATIDEIPQQDTEALMGGFDSLVQAYTENDVDVRGQILTGCFSLPLLAATNALFKQLTGQ